MWLWRPWVRVPSSTPLYGTRSLILAIRLRVRHTGLSPSGKATDFDSVIPWVRIPPAQPRRGEALYLAAFFYAKCGFGVRPGLTCRFGRCWTLPTGEQHRSFPQKVTLRLRCSLINALTTLRLATNFLRIRARAFHWWAGFAVPTPWPPLPRRSVRGRAPPALAHPLP